MRIWHQSFTDLTVMPLYRKTITEHAAAVMGQDATVKVHGLRPGTYTVASCPMTAAACSAIVLRYSGMTVKSVKLWCQIRMSLPLLTPTA